MFRTSNVKGWYFKDDSIITGVTTSKSPTYPTHQNSMFSASQSSMVAGGFAELNKLTEMIKFASIIVAAAPMLIVYPFVQKYFEKGFMAGAVKG